MRTPFKHDLNAINIKSERHIDGEHINAVLRPMCDGTLQMGKGLGELLGDEIGASKGILHANVHGPHTREEEEVVHSVISSLGGRIALISGIALISIEMVQRLRECVACHGKHNEGTQRGRVIVHSVG